MGGFGEAKNLDFRTFGQVFGKVREERREREKKKEKREGREGGHTQLQNLTLGRYLYKGRLLIALGRLLAGLGKHLGCWERSGVDFEGLRDGPGNDF